MICVESVMMLRDENLSMSTSSWVSRIKREIGVIPIRSSHCNRELPAIMSLRKREGVCSAELESRDLLVYGVSEILTD